MSEQLARHDAAFSDSQVETWKRTFCKGATDDEANMFVQTAKRLRLDPHARQIWLVKRYDSQVKGQVATPQVSIDGLRLIAERTGDYAGQSIPQWCGKDGKWTDVWLEDGPPAAARVGVYRKGFVEALIRVARYASYVQVTDVYEKGQKTGDKRPNSMWAKMPDAMLAKCAESLALRAAFPNELSGVYTDAEMGHAENPEPAPRAETRPALVVTDGPRFIKSWSKEWGGKPLVAAPLKVLSDYIGGLEAKLAIDDEGAIDSTKLTAPQRAVVEGSLSAALELYERLLAEELHKQEGDALTEKLTDELGKTATVGAAVDQADVAPEWGMTP